MNCQNPWWPKYHILKYKISNNNEPFWSLRQKEKISNWFYWSWIFCIHFDFFKKYHIRCYSSWLVYLGHTLKLCAWDDYLSCFTLATSYVNELLSKYSPRSIASCLLEISARSWMPFSCWTWNFTRFLHNGKRSVCWIMDWGGEVEWKPILPV